MEDSLERIAEMREHYVRLLGESLREIVDKLSALDEVERVSLFGSYARGRADLFTDLDILVVMTTDESLPDRLKRLYSYLSVPVDMDLLCYTPAEFESLKRRPFLKSILAGERVLYEKRSGR